MGVELRQGGAVDLGRPGGGGVSVLRMGLGWKGLRGGGIVGAILSGGRDLDLDASAVLFGGGEARDVVFFQKLASDDGSVTHTGDSLRGGSGRGDEEAILVDLARVPPGIDGIVFLVSVFTGQQLSEVRGAYWRLTDDSTGRELARHPLTGDGGATAQVLAKLRRGHTGWQLTPLGAPAHGRTYRDLVPVARYHL